MRSYVEINRAPVLTLWAAVVAERVGFRRDEALTFGRVVTGLNAYAKGRSLGLFSPSKKKVSEARKELAAGRTIKVELLNRAIPAKRTKDGLRALSKGKPVDPDSVKKYLESKFGDGLGETRKAMAELARAYSPAELTECAYDLYVKFRPKVPGGKKGWGAKGRLSLKKIRSLPTR